MKKTIALPLIALTVWLFPTTSPGAGEVPPPDLYLEWMISGRPVVQGPPIEGQSGDVVTVDYRVRNVGGRDAFGAVIHAHTALGRVGPPVRLQPGPKAGTASDRSLSIALAQGMRELCIEVVLRNLNAEDPDDPEPDNNRRCRRVEVRPVSSDESSVHQTDVARDSNDASGERPEHQRTEKEHR